MLRPFWFRKVANYGDILTPYILQRLEKPYIYTNKELCNSLFIGSIAKLAKPNIHIYGSGFIRQSDPVCANAHWEFVRGPLTRQMVINAGGKCPEIYGDIALIMPEFVKPEEKIHDIGYIPHHVEMDLFPKNEFVVKLENKDVVKTAREITKCRKVISSSLHGLIVAHAYGIPAAYVKMSDRLSGDGMKFDDYYKSVGLELVRSTIDNPVFQVPTEINITEIMKILREIRI
jgi:hypothetical protein